MLRSPRKPQVTKAFPRFWACSFWATDVHLGLLARVEENADGSWHWQIDRVGGDLVRSSIVAQGNKQGNKQAKRAARVAALKFAEDGKTPARGTKARRWK